MGRGNSFLRKISFLLACVTSTVYGQEPFAGLPFFEIFPTTTGIIFPSFLSSAGVNPAALPQKQKKNSAFGLGYSPAPGGAGDHRMGFSYATADSRLGFGAGYQGAFSNSITNGGYLGGGFRTESTAIGLSVRAPDFGNLHPSADLGILAHTRSDFSFGLVLYKLESSPQLDFGIGFGKEKKYNFELNVLSPSLANAFQPQAEYIITAATTVYAGIFGLSFNSSYNTNTADVTQSVSVIVWFLKNCALTLQYRSPNRTYYGLILPF